MNLEEKTRSIAFIINSINAGGAPKMVRFVANYSVPFFQKVYLISLYDSRNENSDLSESIVHIPLGIRLDINKIKRRVDTVKAIRKAIKCIKPTLVCAFVSDVAYLSRFATLGLPIIFTSAERGDPTSEKWLSRLFVRWAYKNSDACFFQLPGARDCFCESIRKKAFVIPNSFPSQNRVQPFMGEKDKIIVSAGRFTVQKGFEILIDAFRVVHQHLPEYKLVLFGKGILYDLYLKLVSEYGLDGYVEFPGYCENVPAAIRRASVFVLSSRWEGIPNTMIEAMSVGVPVIACDCPPGGPKYLSDNGRRARIIPMNDAEAMAMAIIDILNDAEAASAMAERGLSVVAELDERKIGMEWIKSFDKIIAQYE